MRALATRSILLGEAHFSLGASSGTSLSRAC